MTKVRINNWVRPEVKQHLEDMSAKKQIPQCQLLEKQILKLRHD